MHLADDWHKIEKKISAACTGITLASNAAWQTIGPFQQFISQHLLMICSTSLMAVAFIAHFIQAKNNANVSSEAAGVDGHD